MRFGPLEIRRNPAAAQERRRAPSELGASGTINLGGLLSAHEYLADLTGTAGLRVYRRMLASDASVQEAVGHVVNPILNANWTIEPASDDPLDLEITEATRKAYFDWPAVPWQEHLEEALDYLALGHYAFELVWQVVEDELSFEDPNRKPVADPSDPDEKRLRREPTLVPARQFLCYRRFAPRLPETIARWNERDGELVSIEQQVYKDGNYAEIEIPAERLLLYTHRRRGNDHTGRSILRSAYKPWTMKELIEKIASIAVERHGVGVPIGYLPASRANDAAAVERLEEILKNIRSGAFTYAVVPGPKAQASAQASDGYTIEILTPEGGIPDFTPLLQYHRGEIKGAMLARFAELGHGQTGARATGDVQSEVWYDALHALARQVESVHEHPIRQFVDANYDTDRYPKLVAQDIEARNLAEYAEAVSRLVLSQTLKADKSLRRSVRAAFDFPDEDETLEPDESDEDEREPERQPGERPESEDK